MNRMPKDGEIPPRLGGAFHARVRILLRNLGYIERLNKRLGLDYGADMPSRRSRLHRPLFAPNGRTAFDFKSGISISAPSEANKLETKIEELNGAHNAEFSDIMGGVIVADCKIGSTALREAMTRNVYCWDVRYAHFLAKKFEIFQLAANNALKEKQLDEWTTYLLIPGAMSGFVQLRAYVFYQNPLEEMSIGRLDVLFDRFTRILQNYSNLGLPVIVHFKLHSIAEVAEGGEDRLRELMRENEPNIKYELRQCFALDYHLAPWFIYCRENSGEL